MNRLLKAAIVVLCAVGSTAFASTSSVTATITDSDGQTWNNATWGATLSSPTGPPTINKVPVTATSFSGQMNSSGSFSASLTDTSSLDQANATWCFTLTPNASAPSGSVCIPVTGASPSLSTALSAAVKAPRFSPGSSAYGYLDIEISPSPALGASYYNVSMVCYRQFSLVGWTCSSSVGATLPAAPNINTSAGTLAAGQVVSNTALGIQVFGDSIAAGFGATNPSTTNGWAYLLSSDINTGILTNNAVAGNTAGDVALSVFNTLNPSDTANPLALVAVGTNDSNSGTSTVVQISYYQYQMATTTWAGLSSTNKILAGNAAVTQGGTWAADTTFSQAPGLVSQTNGSTLSYPATIGPNGVFYVWNACSYFQSGATYTVQVDGVLATNTITNTTTVSAAQAQFANNHPSADIPCAARYVTTQGAHTLLLTVTSASGSANILKIMGFGFPPAARYRGATSPKVFFSGVPPQLANANATASSAYNAFNLAIAEQMWNDGLNVPFVNVQAALDYNLDFTGTATQNCPASTAVGLHPNNCGHRHIAQAFEETINAINSNFSGPNFNQAINVSPTVLPTGLQPGQGFNFLLPPAYIATLIGGTEFCGGIVCGVKEFNDATLGYGFGMFIDSSKVLGFGFSTGNPTAESGFSWPAWVTSNGYIHSKGTQLASQTVPTCNSTNAGLFQYTQGNSSTKDNVQVCAHDATNTYAWRTIY